MLSKLIQYLHQAMQMVLSEDVWTNVITIVIMITFNVFIYL